MANDYKDIYPLTVIADRYTGTYSGGAYLAFNLEFNEIPRAVVGADVICRYFFYNNKDLVYGRGNTPDEAIKDLARRIMGVDEFLEYLKTIELTDYIIRIRVRYLDEKDYRFINEILTYDGDYDLWIWENDWQHCVEDAKIVGYIPINEIKEFRRVEYGK